MFIFISSGEWKTQDNWDREKASMYGKGADSRIDLTFRVRVTRCFFEKVAQSLFCQNC
jgi:hypothetical protein